MKKRALPSASEAYEYFMEHANWTHYVYLLNNQGGGPVHDQPRREQNAVAESGGQYHNFGLSRMIGGVKRAAVNSSCNQCYKYAICYTVSTLVLR